MVSPVTPGAEDRGFDADSERESPADEMGSPPPGGPPDGDDGGGEPDPSGDPDGGEGGDGPEPPEGGDDGGDDHGAPPPPPPPVPPPDGEGGPPVFRPDADYWNYHPQRKAWARVHVLQRRTSFEPWEFGRDSVEQGPVLQDLLPKRVTLKTYVADSSQDVVRDEWC